MIENANFWGFRYDIVESTSNPTVRERHERVCRDVCVIVYFCMWEYEKIDGYFFLLKFVAFQRSIPVYGEEKVLLPHWFFSG